MLNHFLRSILTQHHWCHSSVFIVNFEHIVSHLFLFLFLTLSVTRQNGESQNGCFKKTKLHQISRKTNISYPLNISHTRTCVYQGVRNVRFSENLVYFVFLKHPFWDLPFCIITDDFKQVNVSWITLNRDLLTKTCSVLWIS